MADRFGRHIATFEEAADYQNRRALNDARAYQANLEAQAQAEKTAYDRGRDMVTMQRDTANQDYDRSLREWQLKDATMRQDAEVTRKQAEDAAMAPMRKAQLAAIELENKQREKALNGSGKPFADSAPPETQIEMLNHFGKFYDLESKPLTPKESEAVINLQQRKVPYAQIAAMIKREPLNDTVIGKKMFGLMDAKGPDPAASAMTWYGAENAPTAQSMPSESAPDPLAQARSLIEQYKAQAASNPALVDSLDDATMQKISDAIDLVEGNAAKPPAMPLQEAPAMPSQQGRIVGESELAAMTDDADGDGQKSRKEVEDAYQQSLAVVQRAEAAKRANPEAYAKLSPTAMTKISQAQMHVKAYQSVYKKQAQDDISSGLGIR